MSVLFATLAIFGDQGYLARDTAEVLEGLAASAAVEAKTDLAARLPGAAAMLRELVGDPSDRSDRPLIGPVIARLRDVLGS